jgi:hypothetical protein
MRVSSSRLAEHVLYEKCTRVRADGLGVSILGITLGSEPAGPETVAVPLL